MKESGQESFNSQKPARKASAREQNRITLLISQLSLAFIVLVLYLLVWIKYTLMPSITQKMSSISMKLFGK